MEYKFNIEEIKEQVEAVLRESQRFNNKIPLNVDVIIEDWLKAKKSFIKKLNGNLIYQSKNQVVFELDEKSKAKKFNEFLDFIKYHYPNSGLSYFLLSLSYDEFFNNKTLYDYTDSSLDICIPKNYKVIKAFKYFITNPTILKDLQNEASRIIQENCISGYLCLSVHPLDFLSASENIHNWRSCHALDGEYRSGNLNYLMDSSTVICYLTSEKKVVLPHFPESVPWNSKKWRVWFYFSDDKDMLFVGRQYPFSSQIGINFIKDKILPKVKLGYWGKFYSSKVSWMKDENTKDVFSFPRMVPVGRTLKPLAEVVIEEDNCHHYNDILYSTCYDALYAYRTMPEDIFIDLTGFSTNDTVFHIGKTCKCPVCGKNEIDYNDVMACRDCANKNDLSDDDHMLVCECCGCTIDEHEAYYLPISNEYICQTCYERNTARCEKCGIRDYTSVVTYNENDELLCPDCYYDD